jgi:hypothetical protein
MKFRLSFLILSIIVISTFVSCNEELKELEPETLDGTYEQLGYGKIATIRDGEFVFYDITGISCLAVLDGSVDIFGENLSILNDTLRLKDGINEYRFVRLNEEPDLCGQELAEQRKYDPLFNFEVLAETFDTHYAYFELRGVNWDSLYTATKSKITSETSEPEFYIILEDMLDSFGDGHIGLDAPGEIVRAADSLRNIGKLNKDQESDEKVFYGDLTISAMVAEHYLKNNLKSSRSELIKWGLVEDDIGYIQINLMMGHASLKLADSLTGMKYLQAYFNSLEGLTSEAHTRLEVEGVKATMNEIMNDLSNTRAIVLDVRFNGGGKDEVGMEIIRNFNPSRHLVFTKKARMGDGYTEANEVYVEGCDAPYTKPMYLLTSAHSASATEIMVMSSLLLDNVNRAGGNTEGVFSDVLDKILPNGWEVGLSNEVYEDTKAVNYEGKGIPPTIDLGYPEDDQELFRQIANDLEADKQKVLGIIQKKQ